MVFTARFLMVLSEKSELFGIKENVLEIFFIMMTSQHQIL